MGLTARIVLGLVFLVSGATKLVDRDWPRSAAAFGVPAPMARLLPVVELALGAALVPGLGGTWAVVAAAGLLVAFTVVIAVRLVGGDDRPECACFGAWSSRPISWRTVGRNGGLLVIAGVAVSSI
ncbi:MAG: MauE/DoxX family redox-associated membrane protein [Actinomycetota bacterium]